MARFELLVSRTPAGFIEAATHYLIRPEENGSGWCIVVPRAHLMREVASALLTASRRRASLDTRTMTTHQLVDHYAALLTDKQPLTPLQVRQIVHATIKELHAESGGEMFRGQVVGGRVSEATLRSLTRLFAEIEPHQYAADELVQLLTKGPGSKTLSQRAVEVTATYARYLKRLQAEGYVGPLGVSVQAAELANRAAPPRGVNRFLFLGLDGSGSRDVAIRLAYALRENPQVEEVWLALVVPDEADVSAWSFYGNKLLVDDFVERTGRRPVLLPCQPPLADRPEDLAALARDPFAYREPPVRATGAVRAIRVPDTQIELEWIAADVKRRILNEGIRPEDIAVIDRSMATRAEEFEHAFARLGIPVVSSREHPIADVPAVRALLTLFRLPAHGWRIPDVIALAESPYLRFGLNPTLLSRIASAGTIPTGAADWLDRIEHHARVTREEAETDPTGSETLQQAAAEAAALETAFRSLIETVDHICGRDGRQTAKEWVQSLVEVIETLRIEEQIYATPTLIDRAQRGVLARIDLDGVNALIRAADDWLAGRQIAALPASERLTSGVWYGELEAIANETKIRSSTYPLKAVQFLNPRQAALRRWPIVYIAGLTDGSFPIHAEPDEHTLSEEERRAIMLPTAEQRAAKERLHFHLAAATATKELILVAAAADDRGKALVTSPFLTCLPLRIEGLEIEQITARSLIPTDESQILTEHDVDLLAAARYRAAIERAKGDGIEENRLFTADPLVVHWLSKPSAHKAVHAWGIEHSRAAADRLIITHGLEPTPGMRPEYVALFSKDQVPGNLAAETAAFSPSELSVYESCHFRFFATRILGLRATEDVDDDPNEMAAFGTLQHRVLERLYDVLTRDGLLPPRSEGDIARALVRLDHEARVAVREYTASAHERLWDLDLEFILDVLRNFVRRDLTAMLGNGHDPENVRIRSRIVALEEPVGTQDRPIDVDIDGMRFRLRGKIDRIEAIEDDRLPDAAQGWLLVRDYKSTRSTYTPPLKKLLAGEVLQLPLYAYMAERHFGGRVFGFGELRTSQSTDPEIIAVRRVVPDGPDGVRLEPHPDSPNPVKAASEAALHRAAHLIEQMRRGLFAPQKGRKCFGCHLKDVCRAATHANFGRARERAQMPVAVNLDTYRQAESRAEEQAGNTVSDTAHT